MSAPVEPVVREATDRRSTRANAIALSGGRMLAALSQWLVLIVLAKLTDVADVGVYALAQAVCIPVAEVARLGLREVRATDVRDQFPSGVYLAFRVAATGVAFAVMVAFGAFLAESTTAFVVIVLYAGTRVVELLSDVLYAILQREERLDLVARSLGLLAVTSLLGLTIGLVATDSVIGATIGMLVAYMAVFVAYDLRVAREASPVEGRGGALRPVWDRAALARLGRRTLPLAVATVLAMVSLHTTRLILVGELGVEALGLFVPVVVLATAPGRVLQAVGTAATTRLAVLHASGRRAAFTRLLLRLLALTVTLSALGVLGAALLGGRLLELVYSEAYREQGSVLVLVVVAAGLRFSAEMLQQAVVAAQRFWWLTANFAITAAVAVASSVVLIPQHGLTGAGASLVIVSAVHLVAVAVAALANLPDPVRAAPGTAHAHGVGVG